MRCPRFTLSSAVRAHPFDHRCADGGLFHIVPILAFKAIYNLEKKRRDNDKKVFALYAEYVTSNQNPPPPSHKFRMKNMMEILLQWG
jgi:hypothetical protein